MSFLGKVYSFQKQERFEDWLKSVGLPDEKIQAIIRQKAHQKIVQNGDSYTIIQNTGKGEKSTTFKSGVEFDDTIGDDNTPIKTSYTVDGNTITQIIKSPLGVATFKREFNGDDLVVTITGDKFDGVAKRYYKA